jgi:peptidoglycan glycosyltransferase
VNVQLRRVALFAMALIAALIAGTTYWQTWATASLTDRQDNAIARVAQFTIRRGLVYASDGKTLLAENRVARVKGETFYFRRYPSGNLAADVVGYSTAVRARAGLEQSMNDYLTASNANLRTIFDKLKGATVTGNSLVLTLDAQAQRTAIDALGSHCGAAVALEPATGKVLVMATAPTYDPNLVEGHFGQIERTKAECSPAGPLINRATSGLYAPGSAFKVVTAAAALDTGTFKPDSTFNDPGYCIEYGKKVSNFADQSGPEVFGHVTFSQALQHSINAVFCQIGKKVGPLTVLDYARRFGFYSVPPLETPSSERAASGLPGRPRPARLRAGADAGDAAPDGDGRRVGREQGRRHAALRRRPRDRAGRRNRHEHAAAGPRPRGQARDGGRADDDDGGGRHRRYRHRCPDPGREGRRQDGYG